MARINDSVNATLRLRSVREDDWSSILAVTNQSVANIPGAGTQDKRQANRRQFDSARGFREQFVAEASGDGKIVGYGAIESVSAPSDPEFRMFIVTAPESLATVGDLLYRSALEALVRAGAKCARFTEYADDHSLLTFTLARGFVEHQRFRIPEGNEIVTFVKDL